MIGMRWIFTAALSGCAAMCWRFFPANADGYAYRVEFFGDEIDRITEIDVLTGEIKKGLDFIAVFPASHYVVPMDKILKAADAIEEELEERVAWFKSEDKLLERSGSRSAPITTLKCCVRPVFVPVSKTIQDIWRDFRPGRLHTR